MLVTITLQVDIEDLDIEATYTKNSLSTEYWGNERTDTWWEVDIDSITYNGIDVDLSDSEYNNVEDYLLDDRL